MCYDKNIRYAKNHPPGPEREAIPGSAGHKAGSTGFRFRGRLEPKEISLLEQKEVIEPELLEEVAHALKVNPEAIKSFDEESAINNINTFYDNSAFNFQCTINPIEKWIEAIEENKRLYEALLKSEREKIALLEKMLNGKEKK